MQFNNIDKIIDERIDEKNERLDEIHEQKQMIDEIERQNREIEELKNTIGYYINQLEEINFKNFSKYEFLPTRFNFSFSSRKF